MTDETTTNIEVLSEAAAQSAAANAVVGSDLSGSEEANKDAPTDAVEEAVAEQNQEAAESTVEPEHCLSHLESEFSEWLAAVEREAKEILAWFSGKLAVSNADDAA